jgi:hypothetical protein
MSAPFLAYMLGSAFAIPKIRETYFQPVRNQDLAVLSTQPFISNPGTSELRYIR